MSEFQMTHVALVGARMESFYPLGFRLRSELAMRRVFPDTGGCPMAQQDRNTLMARLAAQLPLWVHNIITDEDFPARDKFNMSLRRFEGELRDSRDNEVIAAVLAAGFRNRELNPLALPETMPMRQRCAIVMQIETWQEAYQQLERELLTTLADHAAAVDEWLATAAPELEHATAV